MQNINDTMVIAILAKTSNFLLLLNKNKIFSAQAGAKEDIAIVISPNDVAFQSNVLNRKDIHIEDVLKPMIIRNCINLILLFLINPIKSPPKYLLFNPLKIISNILILHHLQYIIKSSICIFID